MDQVRVVNAYVSEFPEPITVKAGERLAVEDRETQWPGWLWCRTGDGAAGWVPASYVERHGNVGTMRRDYDATELTVAVGEVLETIDEAAGWVLCRTSHGRVGWVPRENIKPM